MVFKNGLEELEKLSAEEKNWIAPLPILFDINPIIIPLLDYTH